MKNVVWTLAAAAMTAAPLAAQYSDCALDLAFPAPRAVEFSVSGPQQGFWGVILVSLEASPFSFPLSLQNFVLVGFGYTDGKFVLTMDEGDVPAGVAVYSQGLALYGKSDRPDQLCITEVKEFVTGGEG